jgi:DNA polymerase-1
LAYSSVWERSNYARNTFEVDMSLSQAQQFKQRFFDSYQGFNAYYQKMERTKVKRLTTLSGRIRHFTKGYASLTKALNTPVQGTAADIIKRALVDLGPQLVDAKA